MTKKTDFDGHFFPNSKKDTLSQVDYFNRLLKDNMPLDWEKKYPSNKRALISPHAGYVYSGFTANMGYSLLAQQKAKRIIVIGPSHKVAFNGISTLRGYSKYSTPMGELDIDLEYQNQLDEHFNFVFDESIHKEHSTQTQMPFIKHYLDIPILELVYSKISVDVLSKMIKYILSSKDNLLVISTDLSHFYDKQEALAKDSICINAIKTLDLSKYNGCEACGEGGIKAIISASKDMGLKSHILDYRTSSDYSGDAKSVVGYLSVLFSD